MSVLNMGNKHRNFGLPALPDTNFGNPERSLPDSDVRLLEITHAIAANPPELSYLPKSKIRHLEDFAKEARACCPTFGLNRYLLPSFVKDGVFTAVTSAKLGIRREPKLAPMGRGTPFGAAINIFISFYSKSLSQLLCLDIQHPGLEVLRETCEFNLVSMRSNRIDAGFRIKFSTSESISALRQLIDLAREIEREIAKGQINSWPAIVPLFVASNSIYFKEVLDDVDRLQQGWINTLMVFLRKDFSESFAEDMFGIIRPLSDPSYESNFPYLAEFANSVAEQEQLDWPKILDLLFQSEIGGNIIIEASKFYFPNKVGEKEVGENQAEATSCGARLVGTLSMFSPEMTNWGTAQASFENNELRLMPLPIDAKAVARKFGKDAVSDYWRNNRISALFDASIYLSSDDAPLIPITWPDQIDTDVQAANELSAELIQEATALQKWTIPSGARIDLKFGPFIGADLYEIGAEVYFLWRWPDERYFLASLGTLTGTMDCQLPPMEDFDQEKVESAMKVIMAAIVRDFWVVEDRRQVFALTRARRQKERNQNSSTQKIIYLPRIRYLTDKIALGQTKQLLEYEGRTRHYVHSFFRRANPTARQINIAKRERVIVPQGHTYVRGHYRGGGEAQTLYRSKSALNALSQVFQVIESEIPNPTSSQDWFVFEHDVALLLERLGHTVLHKAVRGQGDAGVDILTSKRAKDAEQTWLIQCKWWSAPVDVAVIRELLGSMTDFQSDGDANVRGMVVTISSFTADAMRLAIKHDISLVDGAELGAICDAEGRAGSSGAA